jgi:hypothetical protein
MSEVREKIQEVFADSIHESTNTIENKILEIVSPLIEENALHRAKKSLSQQIEEFCKTYCPSETDECKRIRCSLKSFLLWTMGCDIKRK